MLLGKVIGSVTASVKAPSLSGVKLLLVQLPGGGMSVAADAVHVTGRGDLVYLLSSKEGAQAMESGSLPVDLAIAGIADSQAFPPL